MKLRKQPTGKLLHKQVRTLQLLEHDHVLQAWPRAQTLYIVLIRVVPRFVPCLPSTISRCYNSLVEAEALSQSSSAWFVAVVPATCPITSCSGSYRTCAASTALILH